jgi:threonine aldolase
MELQALSHYCKKKQLYFYMDGARIGSALTSGQNEATLADYAQLLDAFYIGGTKNGAFMGEALVIIKPELKVDFRYLIKQKGALLAKNRLLAIQFIKLFEDDLFFKLAQHANLMARHLTTTLENLGVEFFTTSPSNQIFPILSNAIIDELSKDFIITHWQSLGDKSVIRIVTSWSTKESDIEFLTQRLIQLIEQK